MNRDPLTSCVATIDNQVGASSVGAGVGSEVDISTLELGRLSVTAHWDHAVP